MLPYNYRENVKGATGMNIGIIGGGAIAKFLLEEINHRSETNLHINSLLVRDENKYANLSETYDVDLYTALDDFLGSHIDIVVEAANIEAVQLLVPQILPKKDVVIISIGAMADEVFYEKVHALADEHGRSIYLPSGAIGGLDLLQNAQSLGGVTKVSLTTRKPAHSLIDEDIHEEVVIFNGPAREAIKRYPKNINVSIILSLAGIGIDETTVKIIADPHTDKNSHHIDISGAFGSTSLTVTNNPLEMNPKTSYLAALSVLGTLKGLSSSIKIGT